MHLKVEYLRENIIIKHDFHGSDIYWPISFLGRKELRDRGRMVRFCLVFWGMWGGRSAVCGTASINPSDSVSAAVQISRRLLDIIKDIKVI